MKELRIIVAGGRDFNYYSLLEQQLNGYLLMLGYESGINHEQMSFLNVKIISGCARGADTLGQIYAINNALECVKFPADWNKYGKSAGYIRNREMAEYAISGGDDSRGVLFAFWDGKSRGTNNMIRIAKKLGLEVHIVGYKNKD